MAHKSGVCKIPPKSGKHWCMLCKLQYSPGEKDPSPLLAHPDGAQFSGDFPKNTHDIFCVNQLEFFLKGFYTAFCGIFFGRFFFFSLFFSFSYLIFGAHLNLLLSLL